MKALTFERTEIQRIRIHVLPTDRFKTYAISLYIGTPLTEQTVTTNALIPYVLRRGNEQYPKTKQFRERLDELYGAGFGFDIYKRGNHQIVQFRMDTIVDRYTDGSNPPGYLLQQSLQFLLQTISRPALENGQFLSSYVHAEKQTVRKNLQSIINDKIRYAAERCIQEMYPNDPFRFHAGGRLADLDQIEPSSLYTAYKRWLSEAQIDLYVVGDTTLDEVASVVQSNLTIERQPAFQYALQTESSTLELHRPTHTVIEQLPVNQGKLNMGLHCPVYYDDDAYVQALMYNGILGSYPHSKLFTNVREKASLAYYASSRYDGFKGMLMIQSGIEIGNYEKTVQIIEEQLTAIREGDISELELSQTKAMMHNQFKEIYDSSFAMIGFDFNAQLTGKVRTIPNLIEQLQAVNTSDIQHIAEQVQLSTIYFLRDKKEE